MMLRKLKTTALLMAMSGSLWFAGCSSSSPNQVAVTVTPASALAVAGTVTTFSATVTGSTNIDSSWTCSYSYTPVATTTTPSPKAVTGTCTSGMSLNGGNVGAWTTNQSTVNNVLTYTAPTLANFPNPIPTLTFTAAASANSSKKGTATIALDSGIRVSVTPPTATAPVGLNPAQQIQFTANLPSNAPTGLTWLVTQPVTGDTTDFPNGAAPGAPTCSPNCGSISNVGVYTAPSTMPTDTFPKSSGSNAATAAITVTVVVNSPADTAHFATAAITLVNASTNPITFNSMSPTTIAAGGILQDVFLNAHNILNTTAITFTPPGTNQQAQAIDPTNIFTIPISSAYCTPSAAGVTPVVTCDASIMTRIRLSQSQLANPGTGQITVNGIPGSPTATPPCTATANSGGNTTNISCPIDLVYASPAMVTAVPDSFPQGNNTSFSANGGYYGGGSSPIVNLLFNGGLNIASAFNARQFTGPLDGGQIQTPGLFPVSVVSNAPLGGTGDFTPPPFPQVWSNVAVQPTFANLTSTPLAIALPVSGSNTNLAPSSMALNSAKGYAVITEQANNSIQMVNLTNVGSNGRVVPQMQGGPIAVGNAPTSIAIDNGINLRNFPGQDLGVVVNSGDNTLTLVALPSGTIIGSPVSLAGLVPGAASAPYGVGVDPSTHYAVVALSNSNIGYIVDVNPSGGGIPCFNSAQSGPPCAIATVSLNTGATPQVIMQPDAPLAYVTPGGFNAASVVNGVTSVVNLLQSNQSVAISASPNGAVRTNNVVTITTNVPNGLNQANPGTVLVAGVTPADFNGTFNVLSAATYTFTYTQSGANETGGGGSVTFGNPYYTFSTTSSATGGAINPITRTFAFADPNAASNSQIGFIRTLDQTVTSLSLSKGSCNGCTPNPPGVPEPGLRYVSWDPYTNVLIAFNPQTGFNEISLINPGGPSSSGTVGPYRIIQAIQTGQNGTGSYTPSGSSTPVSVFGPMVYDPKTNLVLAANSGSNNLTYLDLDPGSTFKKVHVQDIQLQLTPWNSATNMNPNGGVPSSQPPLASVQNPPPVAICDPTNPTNIYDACLRRGVTVGQQALLRVLGQGFQSGGSPTVRLDGDPTGVTITSATDSEVDVTIAASRLTVPHDYALDVVSGNVNSNTSQLFAVQVTHLAPCGSGTPAQPEGVAIDGIRNVAVVTNYGCNSVSFISLDAKNAHNYGVPFGSVLSTFPTGNAPLAVDVIPRLGYAVVTNKTDGTVTIINMSNPLSPSAATGSPVTVGVSPIGVTIDQDRALALVANNGGNSLSSVDLTTLELSTPKAPPMQLVPVSGPPTAIAVDPNRAEAVLTNIQNTGATGVIGGLDVITLSGTVPMKSSTASIITLTANPTGIVYDPAVSPALFYATSTQENAVYSFNPDTSSTSQIRVGINPYSIAYNYQTGTILTLNSTSNTMSVIDSQTFTTRETFGMTSQSQFGAAIDNLTNTAVIVDQNNNRVLILGMPR
jgi:DNA-binding beta-propeller fold protein YncE